MNKLYYLRFVSFQKIAISTNDAPLETIIFQTELNFQAFLFFSHFI